MWFVVAGWHLAFISLFSHTTIAFTACLSTLPQQYQLSASSFDFSFHLCPLPFYFQSCKQLGITYLFALACLYSDLLQLFAPVFAVFICDELSFWNGFVLVFLFLSCIVNPTCTIQVPLQPFNPLSKAYSPWHSVIPPHAASFSSSPMISSLLF